MLTYVLVDDSEDIRKRVRSIVNDVMFKTETEYEIYEFSEFSKELEGIIKSKAPKIYILDIELKNGSSGLDIGKYVRMYDWDSELIYLTSHDKMFEKVFRNVYKVFDFIEKFDAMDKRLKNDLKKIVSREWDKKKFAYSNRRVNFEIYFDEINYIYRDTIERKVVIKTCNGNAFFINKNMNEILDCLDERFRQVHRSCIVNTDKVNLYNWAKGYFILENNDKINLLSKKYRFEND